MISAPPASVRGIDPAGIVRAQLIDATPIGANVRSTVATYCGVLDDLRRAFARTDEAKAADLKAGAFSIMGLEPLLRFPERGSQEAKDVPAQASIAFKSRPL